MEQRKMCNTKALQVLKEGQEVIDKAKEAVDKLKTMETFTNESNWVPGVNDLTTVRIGGFDGFDAEVPTALANEILQQAIILAQRRVTLAEEEFERIEL